MTPPRLAAVGAALLLAACGSSKSSSHTRSTGHRASTHTLCLPEVKALLATTLSVDPGTITTATGVGTNGNPQCTFTAHTARHTRVAITANEYSGPQPYFILERTEIEASQVFTPSRLSPAPQTIMHLGLEAAWFPATQALMATDAIRLIDITFRWPGASQAQKRRLGIALARPYLKGSKQGEKLAKGYP
jgi:hypothetical protein